MIINGQPVLAPDAPGAFIQIRSIILWSAATVQLASLSAEMCEPVGYIFNVAFGQKRLGALGETYVYS